MTIDYCRWLLLLSDISLLSKTEQPSRLEAFWYSVQVCLPAVPDMSSLCLLCDWKTTTNNYIISEFCYCYNAIASKIVKRMTFQKPPPPPPPPPHPAPVFTQTLPLNVNSLDLALSHDCYQLESMVGRRRGAEVEVSQMTTTSDPYRQSLTSTKSCP